MFEELADCMRIIGQTELDTLNQIQSEHGMIVESAGKISARYNLDCFLRQNPCYSEQIVFQYEPARDDPVGENSSTYVQLSRFWKILSRDKIINIVIQCMSE